MQKKNKLKIFGLVTLMLASTVLTSVNVYSAVNNSLVASDNISFTADKYVSAEITDGTNTYVFSDLIDSDNDQIGNFINISENDFKSITETEKNDRDIKTEFVIQIKNTSLIKDNKLLYSISHDFEDEHYYITLSEASGSIAYNETKDIKVTIFGDERYDLAKDVT